MDGAADQSTTLPTAGCYLPPVYRTDARTRWRHLALKERRNNELKEKGVFRETGRLKGGSSERLEAQNSKAMERPEEEDRELWNTGKLGGPGC